MGQRFAIGDQHVECSNRPDDFSGEICCRLPIETVRALSQRDRLRSSGQMLWEWGMILAAAWLCAQYWHPLGYVLTVMWIGARQHALAILMHDGAHYLLLRSKRWNDVITEVFLAWPIFITMRAYRQTHWAHHRAPNTEQDPDWIRKQNSEWQFPKSGRELAAILLKDASSLHTYQQLMEIITLSGQSGQKPPRWYQTAWGAFYALIAVGLTLWHGWNAFLLYWIVPSLTWLKVILRIRSIAEHFCFIEFASNQDLTLARTTLPSWWERVFVAPNHINYHLDHHLYPSVPFYRLPQLHEALLRTTGYAQKAHLTTTYWGVLRECVLGTPQRPSSATQTPTSTPA